MTTGLMGRTVRHFKSPGNVFTDNWSGIVAWENADRFAGSPANTSTGVGTLVNPSVAIRFCLCDEIQDQEAAVLRRLPVEDTERPGRGKHVRDRRLEDPGLQTVKRLWFQRSLFQLRHLSTLVAVQGEVVVQKDITFKQNNVWRNNTYTGILAFHG